MDKTLVPNMSIVRRFHCRRKQHTAVCVCVWLTAVVREPARTEIERWTDVEDVRV